VDIWTVCNNIDIDECATNNGGCSTGGSCVNNEGSFTCTCLAGYTGDGFTCTGNVNVLYVMPIGSLIILYFFWRIVQFLVILMKTNVFFALQYEQLA